MLADNEVVMDEGGKRAWFYVDESQDDVALFFETPLQAFEYAMKKWGTQL